MDNYKIKVKDEADSKEAQELFFELGYRWNHNGQKYFKVSSGEILAYSRGVLFQCGDDTGKELTLPQLRDIVVLKRNDVKDSNCTYRLAAEEKNYAGYLDSNDWMHIFKDGGWQAYVPVVSEELKAFYLNSKAKDPALISGAEALRALADGKEVESLQIGLVGIQPENWLETARTRTLTIFDFISGQWCFRLKPTTLKVNAELPKPQKETQHNAFVYAVTYEFKTREERNAFADKLRGANS
ncbi:hypothetical protein WDA45_13105 [Acinetobacter pittii]|uniref:hypothetical protein n=1 Tax=Acinetobacter pittii TaxID=48296 RepID=UPI00374ED036